MKNKKTVAIAFGVMLLVAGIIGTLSVRAAAMNKTKWTIALGGSVELRNTIELPLSQVGELEIAYTRRNLIVLPAEGENIIIKEYLITDKEEGKACVSYEEIAGNDRRRAVVTAGSGTI